MKDKSDRARIVAPPPLLGLGCIALGFVGEHFKPLPLFRTTGVFQIGAGVLLIAIAAAIIFSARRTFLAHSTPLNPYRPTEAVVVTGIYRFSRNPIYIAFLLIVLTFALFANSLWFIGMAGILFFILHFGVVHREEDYLSEKFGDPYREYCRQVRRWI
jgi:protein-S-isoprenylcysteine O-methyltransferase Ste14